MSSEEKYVDETIKDKHVVVWSKSYCPYCNKVKELFKKLNVEYYAVELDKMENGSAIQAILKQKTGQSTAPNVFIKGKHIGGCDDTFAANKAGTLKVLLEKTEMSSFNFRCVSWNILADGRSSNEFITNGGDEVNTLWTSRRSRICQILQKFLKEKVQVIGLQENDHPYFILSELQKFKPEIRCLHLLAKDISQSGSKLRLNAIFHYLNSNDVEFKKVTENLKNSEQNYDKLYSRVNDWYKTNKLDQISRMFTMTSFKEEKSEILANILNRSINDLYVVNDGISIYYDSSILEFIEPITASQMAKTEFPTLFTGHNLACRFKILKSNVTSVPVEERFLRIICSHIKSGEGVQKEKKRVEQIRDILKLADANDEPSVILLDSNTSNLYREDIEKLGLNDIVLVDNVIREAGFQNIIPTKGNECFKMRHAQGGQPKKFGNIMFDTIDKIILKPELCKDFKFVKPNWLKTLPAQHYEEILSWRTSDERRNELKSICCKKQWGDDMNKNDTSESRFDKNIFLQLYPNQYIPSDHPPVMGEINFKI